MLNERYKNPMSALFTNQRYYDSWKKVETAVIHVRAHDEVNPSAEHQELLQILDKIEHVDAARVDEIENKTKHDMNAHVRAVAEQTGVIAREMGLDPTLGRLYHQDLTSYDIEDPAQSRLLREAGQMLYDKLTKLVDAAHKKATMFKYAPANGFTHNQIAEPVTIGKRFLDFEISLRVQLDRFKDEIEKINLCKIKGAVGIYGGNLSPKFEADVARELGMRVAPIATQILPIENLLQFFNPLLVIACSVKNFTQNLRLEAGSLAGEVKEGFSKGQTGSSTMTAKENTINLEQLAGAARKMQALYAELIGATETWQERDISNSFQVQRHIIPEMFETMWHIAARLASSLEDLRIFPIQALRNICNHGDYMFAGAAKGILAKNLSLNNDKVYELVQGPSIAAKSSAEFRGRPVSLYDALAQKVREHVAVADRGDAILAELKTAMSLPYNLRNIDGYWLNAVRDHPNYPRVLQNSIHADIVDYIIESGQLEKFDKSDSEEWIRTYQEIVLENYGHSVSEDLPSEAFNKLVAAAARFRAALENTNTK